MKCYICDATLSEVQFNSQHEDIDPCPSCLTVVQDTLDGFLDNSFVDDYELGGPEPLVASLSGQISHSFFQYQE